MTNADGETGRLTVARGRKTQLLQNMHELRRSEVMISASLVIEMSGILAMPTPQRNAILKGIARLQAATGGAP